MLRLKQSKTWLLLRESVVIIYYMKNREVKC